LARELPTRLLRYTACAALLALVLSAGASAAQKGQQQATKRGTLSQLPGKAGCLTGGSKGAKSCAKARALAGPGPVLGSRAIAVSPDGKNVYVASSKSNAIAIFQRSKATGALTQASGSGGCIAAKGAEGCATAIGLDGPNSVAVSPDGKNVYATSRGGNSIVSFRRNPKNGALAQLPPTSAGCYSALPVPGCASGRGLLGADVVVVSPDGKNVYVGAFLGNAVAAFTRLTESGGALEQKAGSAGCIAEAGAEGCAPGIALGAVEGLAVSRDGRAVYTGSPASNAVAALVRDPETGTLSQATDGTGCIAAPALAGCTTGVALEAADAVATSPGNDVVYVTSLLSNSVTVFQPATSSAGLAQKEGPAGCTLWLKAAGCGFAQAMSGTEGLAVSPDGASLYVVAFSSSAIDVFDRNRETGTVLQKPNKAGCLAVKKEAVCTPARAMAGVASVAVSPDNRNVYTTSFLSNAVDVFRRHR